MSLLGEMDSEEYDAVVDAVCCRLVTREEKDECVAEDFLLS